MTQADIALVSLRKSFGATQVVHGLDLEIPQGEFVSILGPSGCGKTTTLNMIAGFEQPTSGQIMIRGKAQNGVPPEKRGIGLVFQNYALFPHMTVEENVAFGLKMQGKPKAELAPTVARALKRVHLEQYGSRYPKELSGGQQQRTALARAIAPGPSVLLLDEPLSNLDLKLREAMRIELKALQRELGMTFVYVTHDQDEAMAMSDRIVVMNRGHIAQQGAPNDIYATPTDSFVADFIGKSNLLEIAGLTPVEGGTRVALAGGALELLAAPGAVAGAPRFCCIRPESVEMRLPGSPALHAGENELGGRITTIVHLGAFLDCWITLEQGVVLKSLIRSARIPGLAEGQQVQITIRKDALRLLAE
ncbi:MAG: ABC transporter ATP-binding protein [Paracoccus aminovorans]|nr:ABC transporter ATP-binding protein [Paracoccus aminovorans]